jgi:FkbM family methyltransferase
MTSPARATTERPMNFDDALKHYLPRIWFRYKFIKYKHLGRGEPELRLVRHFIEPGMTVVDVGASIGIYSSEMARYAGKVLAFEANPDVAAFTRAVAPRNVEVINVALSSRSGRTTLTMPLNRKGNATTELATIERSRQANADQGFSIEVETRRLDDFPVSNCGFIKIDVEGHEEAVLDGAAALIATRPVLMIELIESYNPGVIGRLHARFAALSYECLFFSRGALRPVIEFDAARDQNFTPPTIPGDREFIANFLFVPAEKTAWLQSRLR